MKSDKKNRGIIIFLLLLVLVIGYLSYKNSKDYEELQEVFKQEKKELQGELNKIITDYDDVLNNKIKVSDNLSQKRQKIVELLDSIKNLKEKNYSLMRGYRKKINILEKENRVLFAKVDSLNQANDSLVVENTIVKEELEKQNNLTKNLTQKYSILKNSKKTLENKVAVASEIEIDGIEVSAMKLKSNETYTTTSRSRKTDAFRLSLNLLENDIAKPGKRNIYVSIMDMDKNIISAAGHIIHKNGYRLVYSDVFSVDYNNKEISLISLAKVNRDHIKKGPYVISIYLEGKLIGNRVLDLK